VLSLPKVTLNEVFWKWLNPDIIKLVEEVSFGKPDPSPDSTANDAGENKKGKSSSQSNNKKTD
jgi:hypothetical protein